MFPFPWCSRSNHYLVATFHLKKQQSSVFLFITFFSLLPAFLWATMSSSESPLPLGCNPLGRVRGPRAMTEWMARILF